MSHREPRPNDAPVPDADARGFDGRAHFAPRRTVFQIWHHDHPVSPEYATASEAELFRIFETPGTDDYRVRAVHATDPTPET